MFWFLRWSVIEYKHRLFRIGSERKGWALRGAKAGPQPPDEARDLRVLSKKWLCLDGGTLDADHDVSTALPHLVRLLTIPAPRE